MEASTGLARASARAGSPHLPEPKRARIDSLLVLVVDDDPFNLMVTEQRLSSMGIKPLVRSDGAEAVAVACELQLDLILMDLRMPVLDGFEATAQIRRFEREHPRRRVPVVAYTSTVDGCDLSRLRDCGFDAVLEKPTGAHAMRECITRWCLPASHTSATSTQTGRQIPPAGPPPFPQPSTASPT